LTLAVYVFFLFFFAVSDFPALKKVYFPFQDKAFHFIAFLIGGIIVILFRRKGSLNNNLFFLFSVLILPLAVEFVQFFVPYRRPGFWDAFFGYSGIISGLALGSVINILRNKRIRRNCPAIK